MILPALHCLKVLQYQSPWIPVKTELVELPQKGCPEEPWYVSEWWKKNEWKIQRAPDILSNILSRGSPEGPCNDPLLYEQEQGLQSFENLQDQDSYSQFDPLLPNDVLGK